MNFTLKNAIDFFEGYCKSDKIENDEDFYLCEGWKLIKHELSILSLNERLNKNSTLNFSPPEFTIFSRLY